MLLIRIKLLTFCHHLLYLYEHLCSKISATLTKHRLLSASSHLILLHLKQELVTPTDNNSSSFTDVIYTLPYVSALSLSIVRYAFCCYALLDKCCYFAAFALSSRRFCALLILFLLHCFELRFAACSLFDPLLAVSILSCYAILSLLR